MSEMLKHGGVELDWSDEGDFWRATNVASNIDESTVQALEHVSAGGNKSGIRYGVGPDSITSQVNILWVDWPKRLFDLAELQNSPESVKFFAGCNVCSAINQIKSTTGGSNGFKQAVLVNPGASKSLAQTLPPDIRQVPADLVPQGVTPVRISMGDAILPKYIPVAISLAKKLWLNKFGDAATSVVLALGADVLSGLFDDPKYKSAWQCISDDMVDDVAKCLSDPTYIEEVKKGVGVFVDGYRKDSDILDNMLKSMTRPTDEVLGSIGITPNNSNSNRGKGHGKKLIAGVLYSHVD